MNIAVDSQIIELYFTNLTPGTKSDINKKISNLFSNKNNKFVLSRSYINLLEKYFEERNDLDKKEYIKVLLNDLSNNDRVLSIEDLTSPDLDEAFLGILSKHKEDFLFSFSNSDIESSKKKLVHSYHVNLKKCQKCSVDWFGLTIASDHIAKLRYFDFKDNSEIINLFSVFFSIPKKISHIHIFDRQTNLNHSLYSFILKKKIPTSYYTLNSTLATKTILEQNFGKPIDIYSTNSPDLIHERKILFDNFIIETDEDPMNIVINRDTWFLNFIYSKEDYSKLTQKCSRFNLKYSA